MDKTTEINGFTFANSWIQMDGSSNITIANNVFNFVNDGRWVGYEADSFTGIVLSSFSNPSLATIRNNVFNVPIGMSVYGEAAPLGSSPDNYLHSNVISMDNNFNGASGMIASGAANITSTGDYYTGSLVGMVDYPYMISIADTKTEPNTAYYGTILTLESAQPNALPLSQEFYLSDSALFRNSYEETTNHFNYEETSTIFKNLLANKDRLMLKGGATGQLSPEVLQKMVRASLGQSILLPHAQISGEGMETAMRLANILSKPTEDQKVMIDILKALLKDTEKMAEDTTGKGNPELKKASDDLLQMVANLLLAQAVPGLLKSGDMSNIKAMFSDFDQARAKIMLDYTQSTRPYYENMIKDLAKNMAMLQAKSLISPDMTKEELSKLPPSELDKILEKIRKMKDKTFEEEYILQQEAKYRKAYIDPNKKKLEDEMKSMLKGFTGRISDALKSSEKK